jgi:hypothetical protein
MVNQRLIHEAAMLMSQEMVSSMKEWLPYEERLKALGSFYIACKAGIEAYEIKKTRLQSRLKPTKN